MAAYCLLFFATYALHCTAQQQCFDSAFRAFGNELGDTKIEKMDYDPLQQEIIIGGYSMSIPDYVSFSKWYDPFQVTPIAFLLDQYASIKWMVYLESHFYAMYFDSIRFEATGQYVIGQISEGPNLSGYYFRLIRETGDIINQFTLLSENFVPLEYLTYPIMTIIEENKIMLSFTDNNDRNSYVSFFDIPNRVQTPVQYLLTDNAQNYLIFEAKIFNDYLYYYMAHAAVAIVKIDISDLDNFSLLWAHHVAYSSANPEYYINPEEKGTFEIFYESGTDTNHMVGCLAPLYFNGADLVNVQAGIFYSTEDSISLGGTSPVFIRSWVLSPLYDATCHSVSFNDADTFIVLVGNSAATDSSFLIEIEYDPLETGVVARSVTPYDETSLTNKLKLSGQLQSPTTGYVFGGIKEINGQVFDHFQGFFSLLDLPPAISSPTVQKSITITIDASGIAPEPFYDGEVVLTKLTDPEIILFPVSAFTAMHDADPLMPHSVDYAQIFGGEVYVTFTSDKIVYDSSQFEERYLYYSLIYYNDECETYEYDQFTSTLYSDQASFDLNEIITVQEGHLTILANESYIGYYQITFTLQSLHQEQGSATFELYIEAEIPPFEFSEALKNQWLTVGEQRTYIIPKVKEFQAEDNIIMKVFCLYSTNGECENGRLPSFILVQGRQMSLKPIGQNSAGDYQVRVNIISPDYQVSNFSDFWVYVANSTESPENNTNAQIITVDNHTIINVSLEDVKPNTENWIEWVWPRCRVRMVEGQAQLLIECEDSLPELQDALFQEHIDIDLSPGEETLSWNIAAKGDTFIQLSLFQESLLRIRINPEKSIKIKLLNSNKSLAQSFTLQVDDFFSKIETEENEKILSESFASVINKVLISILGTSIVINIIFSQSILFIWGFISTAQLISHIPLMDLKIPENLEQFYSIICGPLRYQLYSTQTYTQKLFNLPNQTEPYNDKFGVLGYESRYFVVNLEMLLYVYMIYVGILALMLLLYLINRIHPVLLKALNFLKERFMFAFVIQNIIESTMLVLLIAVIDINTAASKPSLENGEIASLVIAYLISVISPPLAMQIIYALFYGGMALVALRSPHKLKQQGFKSLFGQFFGSLNLSKKVAIFSPFWFALRRLVFALLIFTTSDSVIQLIAFQYLSLLQVFLDGFKLYKQPLQNKTELFNEFCTLILADLLFGFTTFSEESAGAIKLARICMGVILTMVFINLLIFISLQCKILKRIYILLRKLMIKLRGKKRQTYNQVTSLTQSTQNNEWSGMQNLFEKRPQKSACFENGSNLWKNDFEMRQGLDKLYREYDEMLNKNHITLQMNSRAPKNTFTGIFEEKK